MSEMGFYLDRITFAQNMMLLEGIIEEAVETVNMFDQTNAGQAVVNLGSRGVILAHQIDRLRKKTY
jgi:hypothetical protein